MKSSDSDHSGPLIHLTSEIVVAHLSNNNVTVKGVPELIQSVYRALQRLGAGELVEKQPEPAVPIRRSVKPDHLVCLEDGKKVKMLRRYLMNNYGLTPEQYRERWGLPSNYPMVAPQYTERRRTLAKEIGLGRKPGQKLGRAKGSTASVAK